MFLGRGLDVAFCDRQRGDDAESDKERPPLFFKRGQVCFAEISLGGVLAAGRGKLNVQDNGIRASDVIAVRGATPVPW